MADPHEKESTTTTTGQDEFSRGWRIIVLSFIGSATAASTIPTYSMGAMIVPLEEAFNWRRSDLLATITFVYLSMVFSSHLAGWMNKKYGMKPVTIGSLILLSISFFLMSQMDRAGGSIWILYTALFLLTFAGVGTLPVTWTTLTGLWFEKKRGVALAIVMSGTGVSAFCFPPLIAYVTEAWGWRAGFITMGLLPLVFTLPLALKWSLPVPVNLLKKANESLNARRSRSEMIPLPGIDLKGAIRSWRFWLISVSMGMVASGIVVMIVNGVPLLRDMGYSSIQAGQMFSAYGISLIVGRILVGYLVDHWWAPGVAFIAMALPGVGCLLLLMDMPAVYLVIGIAMVGVGAGAEMELAAYLVARYFGMRDYGRLFGIQFSIITGAICLGPVWSALVYEITEGYRIILIANIIMFTIGAALPLALGKYPHFKAMNAER